MQSAQDSETHGDVWWCQGQLQMAEEDGAELKGLCFWAVSRSHLRCVMLGRTRVAARWLSAQHWQ